MKTIFIKYKDFNFKSSNAHDDLKLCPKGMNPLTAYQDKPINPNTNKPVGGEPQFGIGTDLFFFYNLACESLPKAFIYSVKDLVEYMNSASIEYFLPTQEYCNKDFMKKMFHEKYDELQKTETGSSLITLHLNVNVKTDSWYLSFDSAIDREKYYFFRKIIIPANTQKKDNTIYSIIRFYKFQDSLDQTYIFMKPIFIKPYTDDELTQYLYERVKDQQLDTEAVSALANKFVVRFRHQLSEKKNDLETIISNLEFEKKEKLYKDIQAALNSLDKILKNEEKEVHDYVEKVCDSPDFKTDNLQRIYYGAPGTGKSNEVKELTGKGKNGIRFEKDCTFRTTFHPDSDYASFVGAYKPYWDKDKEKIVYGFRPQSFLKAYIKAWKNPNKNVALVVEEINRGNCAQIFGDIFQLLDREKNGLSKYPIECDVEMQELLADEFGKESKEYGVAISDNTYADSKEGINNYYSAHYEAAFDKIKNGEILALPMNLSILATMNTSDQSLFPMDSAFKRRWEWIYEPIVEGKKMMKDDGGNDIEVPLGWKIELGKCKLSADGEEKECVVDWWKFLQKINAVIYSLTSSEDKQLGYFFCQPDNEDGVTISKKLFVGKVIFYLWNEIFKDYAFEHDVCKKENKSDTLYFADFYDGKNVIKQTSLETFFKHLDENQPKIDGKDVKLIEEKTTASSAIDTPVDAENKEETPVEETPAQSEETVTENTEA